MGFVFSIIAAVVGLLAYYLLPLIFSPPTKLKDPPIPTKDTLGEYSDVKAHWTEKKDVDIPIVVAKTGPASDDPNTGGFKPTTIYALMKNAVKLHGEKAAMRVERPVPEVKGKKPPPSEPVENWKTWTYKQYFEDARNVAKGLIALGTEPYDAVNIFGFNSPEWFLSQLGAIFCGGVAAGIYPSDTAEQVKYKCHQSGAAVAICEDNKKVSRFEKGINELPKLKAIVVWGEKPEKGSVARKDGSEVKLLTWDEMIALGKATSDEKLEARIADLKPSRVAGYIYTSGTTGAPKAVMVSHDNILWESHAVMGQVSIVGEKNEEERLISYLPLSHVAGMMVDIICPLFITSAEDRPGWVCVFFARPYDLKLASIVERFKAVRPTMFLGVPRVWEKIAEKLQAIGKQTKGLVKTISTTAKKLSLEHAKNCQVGGSGEKPVGYGFFKTLVLDKIRAKLGLDKMKFGFTGAAPITKETLSYFGSLGIQVNEVYGMSESTAAVTWSTDETHLWGSCGYALPGCEVKILKESKDGSYQEVPRAKDVFHPTEGEQGEICFRGRNIMLGYMANPDLGTEHVEQIKKKNASAIDKSGWLHSGDKGAMSNEGMVKITGRYKEIIIGAGGENVAPVPIESNVKKLCPAISNIMMFGDKMKFNVALITLKAEGATGEKPGTDKLTGPAAEVKEGITTIPQACKDQTFIKMIKDAIIATNKDGNCCPSNAAKIQRFTILPHDFSVETNDLTPTLKLKRSVVAKKYEAMIEKIYAADRTMTYVPFEA
eukprot:CAMPEP_0184490810 /NCGR_PEP_ID=MMETSP0113_2-20130426/18933_1 /TAXON_ID=91329 /ORGANISM="Norrisiella sphaerica, Strain BC52" /LENGTH=770 /DNA_ID=CAMNT_0026874905 /DNA_START=48 /DNA_END=2360 /DNA_ORIENTATION=-